MMNPVLSKSSLLAKLFVDVFQETCGSQRVITRSDRPARRLFTCCLGGANRKGDPSFTAGNRLPFANTEQDYTRCRSEKVARAI